MFTCLDVRDDTIMIIFLQHRNVSFISCHRASRSPMSRAAPANRRRVRFIPLHSCDASIIVLGEGDAKDRKLRSPMTTDSVHSSILLAHVARNPVDSSGSAPSSHAIFPLRGSVMEILAHSQYESMLSSTALLHRRSS